ncbi:ATPase domain-containing protein [Candidatus Altiarchaeota archaeon]
MEEDRCRTGIPGLDEMLNGGLPRGRSILLAGTCGTGKTTFCSQFLYNGAMEYNEPGVMVVLEQKVEYFKKDMISFGFDMDRLEDEKKLSIIDAGLAHYNVDILKTFDQSGAREGSFSLTRLDTSRMGEVLDSIVSAARSINAKRIVIDSLPALDNLVEKKSNARDAIIYLAYVLQEAGLTSLLISEIMDDNKLSNHDIESYIADGVMVLHANEVLNTRTIQVKKMRDTKHSLSPRTIEFTEKGFHIPPEKKII